MSVIVNQAYSTVGNGGRKIVRLSNGWEVVVVKATDYFHFYVDKKDGSGFRQLCSTNYTTIDNNDVSIVTNGTTVHAIFGWTGSGISPLKFDATTVSGNISGGGNIDGSQTVIGNVSLAIDPSNGHLHAVWASKNSTYPNSFNIRYAKSTDGGVTWSAVTQLTTWNISGHDNTSPTITVRNGSPIIIFQSAQSTSYYRIDTLRFSGTAWTLGSVYSAGTYTQSSPSTVVDKDGVIHAVWYGKGSTHTTTDYIMYSKSTDGGVTWSPTRKLFSGTMPSITSDLNGKIAIAYQSGNGINITDSSDNFASERVYVLGSNPSLMDSKDEVIEKAPKMAYMTSTNVSYTNELVKNIVVAQPYSTAGNGGRKLVRLSNGWLVAVARDIQGFKTNFYKSTDNGETWSLLTTYSGNCDAGLAIISSGTNVYALITHSNNASNVFIKFDAATVGTTFDGILKNIDSSQLSFGECSLAIDPSNGHLHATWASKNATYPNSFNLRYSKSMDNGVTWSAVEQVTTSTLSGWDSKNPTILVKDGNPVIIFENIASSTYRIWTNTRTVNGWNTASSGRGVIVYDGGSYSQSSPSAVVDKDGIIHVTWHGADSVISTANNIKYSKSTDGGVTWSTMERVVSANETMNYPSITVDKNNNVIIMYSHHLTMGLRKAYKVAGVWNNEQIVSVGSKNTTNPSTLYDPIFSGEFGETPPIIYQTPTSVEYIGSYATNQAPTLITKNSSGDIIDPSISITIPKDTNLQLKITASDTDEGQTLQYKVSVSGVEVIPLTEIQNNIETNVEINKSAFIIGMNAIAVTIRDSEGAEVTFQFNVIIDVNLPIDSTCLANMKFNGYSLSTISLAELINYLE